MSTHIDARRGDVAQTVLLPGDPLRAKYIAENFLEDPKLYNTVRNAFGYTGTYKGHPVSVQGTGMGIPSISIYGTELIKDFGVQNLIRVGTCGGMGKDVKLRDVLIAQSASTDSSIIHNTFGGGVYYAPTADFGLLEKAYHAALDNDIPVQVGNIISEDRFYDDEMDTQKLIDYGILGAEMEAAALYLLAAKYHVKALAVLTVSDMITTGESTTAAERETSFNDMITVSLEAAAN
ncbi:purine-nucleoside phosphorylase [Bifidobacterium bohemicum]|uniref:Uridine phosphorylase n=1 Tax=Bifidobacterium bohemicum DSM 22767 TaxID=1437606 RepID=A0A086ZJU1_9BIFI|nr:purine-nucleoside phosphorylase [Bifidobacterium bohemicum]KFI46791.1 purine-nucleoside phosphorylase [Bifidobacterium bohemicum DSM 22767]SCB81552.1 purine-nucleoside phosphorylase [Bifidobacterium bohemicum]